MKIFIDTNIFLDMYRSNLKNDIQEIMNLLKLNSSTLITVEQSINEFERNRYTVIDNAIEEFKKRTSIEKVQTAFVKKLESYTNYYSIQKSYNTAIKTIINDLISIRDNKDNDILYTSMTKIFKENMILESTDENFQKAQKRKLCGNPPTSDKYTIGDELIWETLLNYGKESKVDLILVTKDKTFHKNKEYLISEYNKFSGKDLILHSDLIAALKCVGISVPKDTIDSYQNITWTKIIVTALKNLGRPSSLAELYAEVEDILSFADYGSKHENQAKEATIRGILQRFSSDFVNVYNGQADLFKQTENGKWYLK